MDDETRFALGLAREAYAAQPIDGGGNDGATTSVGKPKRMNSSKRMMQHLKDKEADAEEEAEDIAEAMQTEARLLGNRKNSSKRMLRHLKHKEVESFRGGGEGGGGGGDEEGGDAPDNDGSGEGGEYKGQPKDGRSIDQRRSTQAIALEVLARLETLAQRQAQLAEEQRTVATEQAQLNRVLSDLMQPSESR